VRGNLPSTLTIPADKSSAEIEIRSSGLGLITITASASGLPLKEERLEFIFPLGLIIWACLGGCLGGVCRSFKGAKRGQNWLRKNCLRGCALGLLAAAFVFAGLITRILPDSLIGTELGAFVCAGFFGYGGTALLDKYLKPLRKGVWGIGDSPFWTEWIKPTRGRRCLLKRAGPLEIAFRNEKAIRHENWMLRKTVCKNWPTSKTYPNHPLHRRRKSEGKQPLPKTGLLMNWHNVWDAPTFREIIRPDWVRRGRRGGSVGSCVLLSRVFSRLITKGFFYEMDWLGRTVGSHRHARARSIHF